MEDRILACTISNIWAHVSIGMVRKAGCGVCMWGVNQISIVFSGPSKAASVIDEEVGSFGNSWMGDMVKL